jgi:acyl-CoA hydrolase
LDDYGRPTKVPQLEAETEEDRQKMQAAKERQERRLQEKKGS